MATARFGGPTTCPGACDACAPKAPPPNDPLEAHIAAHHFQGDMVAFPADFGQEKSEPAKLGLLAWYDCKHCEAWAEDLPELDDLID